MRRRTRVPAVRRLGVYAVWGDVEGLRLGSQPLHAEASDASADKSHRCAPAWGYTCFGEV